MAESPGETGLAGAEGQPRHPMASHAAVEEAPGS